MKNKQQGFTLIELIIVIGFLGTVIGGGICLFVVGHFIGKFW